ncbi:MAG: DUF5009 domain-containing protein [Bacteroidaceae bacterium]|nr:DUF5009 domain-containing protein [Bacteroidaceae bacterium]
MTNNRAYALDALRGYAILTMILCSAIAFGVLPGWMYHAQTPPPSHAFNPSVYGITWVDLVFPFFLFAMGAAFPFSIGKKIERGMGKRVILWDSLKRGLKLTYFAIFVQHMYPWVVSAPQDTYSWWIALLSFVLLFLAFTRIPYPLAPWKHRLISFSAYAASIALALLLHYANGKVFSLAYSNIILLVLANMAVIGSICYLFTYSHPRTRMAILPFILALLISAESPESWAYTVLHYSPFPWLYQFHFLKYLVMVLIGSVAGEYLKTWLTGKAAPSFATSARKQIGITLVLCLLLLIANLYGLYMRYLVTNLMVTSGLLLGLFFVVKGKSRTPVLWRKLYHLGSYILLLGLFLESFQGGIRKDDTTLSYLFVTTGLACFALIIFSILCDVYRLKILTKPLTRIGQNPMLAYVSAELVIMPILHLLGLNTYLDLLNNGATTGFLRGVIVTSLCLIFTLFFSKQKLFWRT